MKNIVINPDKLSNSDIDNTVTRVKAIIINSKNDIMLGYCNNTYQFPGGHLGNNETLYQALQREINEETGMKLDLYCARPFLLITKYLKNYLNTGKNRCNKMYYYEIITDEKIDLKHTNYTEDENKGRFEIRYLNLKDVKKIIVNNNKYSKYKDIAYEMLIVLNYYFKLKKDNLIK